MKKAEYLDAWLASASSRLQVGHVCLSFADAMMRVEQALEDVAATKRGGIFRPVVVGADAASFESAWLSTVFAQGTSRPERLRRALQSSVAAHRLDDAVRHLEWACEPDGRFSEKDRRAALRTAHNFMRFDAVRTPTLAIIDAGQLTGRRADALNAAFSALAEAPLRVLLATEGPLIDVLEGVATPLHHTPPPPTSASSGSARLAVMNHPSRPAATASDARPGRRGDEATRAVRAGPERSASTSETERHGAGGSRRASSFPERLTPDSTIQSETRETTERSPVPWGLSEDDDSWAAVLWATGGRSWARLIDDVTGRPGLTASLIASGALESWETYLLTGEVAVAVAGSGGSSSPRQSDPSLHAAVATFIEQREPVDALGWLTELERQWRWAGDDARASAAGAARASLVG